MSDTPLRAIIWDFDNTLVDTRERNRSVTRRIVHDLTGEDPDGHPILRDQAAYDVAIHHTQNWQELYEVHFGLPREAIRRAGRMWTAYQARDDTPIRWFDGIPDVIRSLVRWPQAIVSMNTRANIEAALETADLATAFSRVVGCEEVEHRNQKPHPEGLLGCIGFLLEELAGHVEDHGPDRDSREGGGGRGRAAAAESAGGNARDGGVVLYLGDHPVDAECVRNANHRLAGSGRSVAVVSVAVEYGTITGGEAWPVEPHHRVGSPREILEIVERLART